MRYSKLFFKTKTLYFILSKPKPCNLSFPNQANYRRWQDKPIVKPYLKKTQAAATEEFSVTGRSDSYQIKTTQTNQSRLFPCLSIFPSHHRPPQVAAASCAAPPFPKARIKHLLRASPSSP
jgi:hypothetical protein